eukprot:6202724-Pleurochrysis_carterae.AAC.5
MSRQYSSVQRPARRGSAAVRSTGSWSAHILDSVSALYAGTTAVHNTSAESGSELLAYSESISERRSRREDHSSMQRRARKANVILAKYRVQMELQVQIMYSF